MENWNFFLVKSKTNWNKRCVNASHAPCNYSGAFLESIKHCCSPSKSLTLVLFFIQLVCSGGCNTDIKASEKSSKQAIEQIDCVVSFQCQLYPITTSVVCIKDLNGTSPSRPSVRLLFLLVQRSSYHQRHKWFLMELDRFEVGSTGICRPGGHASQLLNNIDRPFSYRSELSIFG